MTEKEKVEFEYLLCLGSETAFESPDTGNTVSYVPPNFKGFDWFVFTES